MIYDCFTINDEIDLLLLRLEYLSPIVDKFIIVEAEYTFSGNAKPLYFDEARVRFRKFEDKIIAVRLPMSHYISNNAWQNEYYQRNFIKTQLTGLADDDLVHIGDVDEIPNLFEIMERYTMDKPYLIELLTYYYFLNLKTKISFKVNLLTPYKYIKDLDIGDRENYIKLTQNFIELKDMNSGWHFSYVFGYYVEQYQNKLKSFSHQEFNTAYFRDKRRIETCLALGIDFLERYSIYEPVAIEKEVSPALLEAMKRALPLEQYIYKKPPLWFYFNFYHLKYYLKFVVKLRLKVSFDRIFKSK